MDPERAEAQGQPPPVPAPAVGPGPIAPPIRPGPIGRPPSPPVWPRVFGIASTGLGILAILQGGGGLVSAAFFDQLGGLTNDEQAKAAMAAMADDATLSGIGTLLLGALNLVAGILLLRRHRGALPVILWWAVLKFCFVVYVAWGSYQMTAAAISAASPPPGAPGPPRPLMQAAGAFGALFTLLWGWAYPVVVVAWFARPRIREQMRSWRTVT